jgi:hypothetical protein
MEDSVLEDSVLGCFLFLLYRLTPDPMNCPATVSEFVSSCPISGDDLVLNHTLPCATSLHKFHIKTILLNVAHKDLQNEARRSL